MTHVTILLVDDFQPWRSFVASLLQKNPEWQILCEASDGFEAIQKAKEFRPDLIVLDIGLPKLNGIEAAPLIRKVAPDSKILFLSANRSWEVAAAALSAGGHGYVVKSDGASELLVAVEGVLQGKAFVSSTITGRDFTTGGTEEIFLEGGKIAFSSFGLKSPVDGSGKTPVGTLVLQSVHELSGEAFIDNCRVGQIEKNGQLTVVNLTAGPHRWRIDGLKEALSGPVLIVPNETTYAVCWVLPDAPTRMNAVNTISLAKR